MIMMHQKLKTQNSHILQNKLRGKYSKARKLRKKNPNKNQQKIKTIINQEINKNNLY